ncbi:GNAT family N-acetyltransferase [Solibacillus sp. CAU 1738]|uniref:GNAT family N-acetyltransferase n=1 Tax=Solibacillus sp. CAU 1738 TaxID=3140363 RepID=UPI00326161DC
MKLRLAKKEDIRELVQMRWDFTLEDYPNTFNEQDYVGFSEECTAFLQQAIDGESWYIWVAEINEQIVSHIYIELIQKVPRPGRITYPFAYMTNVYTKEMYRGKGIGSQLLSKINQWVKDNNYEFVIVWPSEEGVEFYKRNGYVNCKEALEYFPT